MREVALMNLWAFFDSRDLGSAAVRDMDTPGAIVVAGIEWSSSRGYRALASDGMVVVDWCRRPRHEVVRELQVVLESRLKLEQMALPMPVKKCCWCNVEKPLTSYPFQDISVSKRSALCHECYSA